MALQCKVCQKELDAFSGGRCRQCRQLVCGDCIAEGGPGQADGLLCKNCMQAAEAMKPAEKKESEAPSSPVRKLKIPGWTLALTALVLAGITTYIIIQPYFETKHQISILVFGTETEAQKATERLAEIDGTYVLKKLAEVIEKRPEPARSRAVLAIGQLTTPQALTYLQKLQHAPKTPPSLQSVVYEAILQYNLKNRESK